MNDFYGDDEEYQYEGEFRQNNDWPWFVWRVLILVLLILTTSKLYQIEENTSHTPETPHTEVFVACDGTNCTFTESLEELHG